MFAFKAVDAHIINFEQNIATCCKARVDQVLDDFCLRVDGDCFSGELFEVDTMTSTIEAELDSVVHQAFALHALANAGFGQEINCVLFENPSANALLYVLAAAALDYNGLDSVQVKQVGENKACGPGANDANLRSHTEV